MKRIITIVLLAVLMLTCIPFPHASAQEGDARVDSAIAEVLDSQLPQEERQMLVNLDISMAEDPILKICTVPPFGYGNLSPEEMLAATMKRFNSKESSEVYYVVFSETVPRQVTYYKPDSGIGTVKNYLNSKWEPAYPRFMQDIFDLDAQVEIDGKKATVTGIYLFQDYLASYGRLLCIMTDAGCQYRFYSEEDSEALILSQEVFGKYGPAYAQYANAAAPSEIKLDKFIENYDACMALVEEKQAELRADRIKKNVNRIGWILVGVAAAVGLLYAGYLFFAKCKLSKIWAVRIVLVAVCVAVLGLACWKAIPKELEEKRYSDAKKLIAAIEAKDIPQITQLLESGVDPNQTDALPAENTFAHRPLAVACKVGELEIVKLLLDYGATVEPVEHTKKLLNATVYGYHPDDVEIVKLLLENGMDINLSVGELIYNIGASYPFPHERDETDNPYQRKAEQDMVELLKLIMGNADIDSKDNTGRTLLIWAAREGNMTLAEYCIQQGCDVGAGGIGGDAFFEAISFGNYRTAALLKERVASIFRGMLMCKYKSSHSMQLFYEHTEYMKNVLADGQWSHESPQVHTECYIVVGDWIVSYDPDEGILYDVLNRRYMRLTLGQRERINGFVYCDTDSH